jgi:lipopolysaccharide biosynthesis glycosyltransferase
MRVSFVYVADRRILLMAQYAVMSAALSQPAGRDYHLFCHHFTPGSEVEPFAAAVSAAGGRLHLHTIEDDTFSHIRTFGHISSACFLRIAAVSEVVASADRVIYMDTDTLVFEDLAIEQLDLQGRSIAAVLDMDLSDAGPFPDFVRRGALDPSIRSRYFNSGMMVIDPKRWQREAFLHRFAEALVDQESGCRYKPNCPPNDQCACNTLFADDWTPLPFTYNFQASGKFTEGWQTAKVRHYCGGAKFLPVTLRRNDRRDLALIGEISRRLGQRGPRLPALYELAFRMNVLRNRSYAEQMRRFIQFAEPLQA